MEPLPRLPAAAAVTLLKLSTPALIVMAPVIVFAPVPRVRTPVPVLVNIPAPERGALMVSPPELNWWITKSVAAVSAPVPLIS